MCPVTDVQGSAIFRVFFSFCALRKKPPKINIGPKTIIEDRKNNVRHIFDFGKKFLQKLTLNYR